MISVLFAISIIHNVVGKMPEPVKYILTYPTEPNYLNLTVDPSPEKNYIILLGDWGCDPGDTLGVKTQTGIANKMKSFVSSQAANGMNLLFVGSMGDNFYWSGSTANCTLFPSRWTDIYGELSTDYHWLSVYGNHDFSINDPHAMCAWGTDQPYIEPTTGIPYAGHQLDADKGGCNPKNYHLPDFGYSYTIPELSFEWIVLEETTLDCGPGDAGFYDFTDCDNNGTVGCAYLAKMQAASEEMMFERASNSTNSNFLLVNHYSFRSSGLVAEFTNARKSSDEYTVWGAAGHAHTQMCDQYTSDGVCNAIQSGGGGTGGGSLHGFYVIGFDENKKMIQPYAFNDTRISCMPPCGQSMTEEEMEESKFYYCCHDVDSAQDCHLYDLTKCSV